MSIQKPKIRKPKVPKLKKQQVSKRKRIVKKSTTLSIKKPKTKIPSTKIPKTKKSTKTHLGTCYLEKNCARVIAKKVSKTQCRIYGGKSWKKIGGKCEKL